jgi:hypothetical protein
MKAKPYAVKTLHLAVDGQSETDGSGLVSINALLVRESGTGSRFSPRNGGRVLRTCLKAYLHVEIHVSPCHRDTSNEKVLNSGWPQFAKRNIIFCLTKTSQNAKICHADRQPEGD